MVRPAGTHKHFTQGCGFQRRLASTWQSSGNPWFPVVVDLASPGRPLAPLATLDSHWPVLARPCSRRDSLGRPSQKVDAPTLSGPCEATRSNWMNVRPGALSARDPQGLGWQSSCDHGHNESLKKQEVEASYIIIIRPPARPMTVQYTPTAFLQRVA